MVTTAEALRAVEESNKTSDTSLQSLVERVTALEVKMNVHSLVTADIKNDTTTLKKDITELLRVFNNIRGMVSFFAVVGQALRWFSFIAIALATIYTAIMSIKTGKAPTFTVGQ